MIVTDLAPHGGLRFFHQKSTYLDEITFKAVCGIYSVTQPSNLEATEASKSTVWYGRLVEVAACDHHGCTSLIRNTPLLEPYSRTMPRVLW